MNNKKTYGIFLAVQTERKYHMSPKKLLKKLLNVNCIKIINASFEVTSQSLYIHVKLLKENKSVVQSVAENVQDMMQPLSVENGDTLISALALSLLLLMFIE